MSIDTVEPVPVRPERRRASSTNDFWDYPAGDNRCAQRISRFYVAACCFARLAKTS